MRTFVMLHPHPGL